MVSIITIVHVFICVLLILLVLLQQGKGADVGATFGGSSNTFFGAGGADNLLTKVTTILAVLFMTTSLFLARGIRDTNTLEGSVVTGIPGGSGTTSETTSNSSNSKAKLVPTSPQPDAPSPGSALQPEGKEMDLSAKQQDTAGSPAASSQSLFPSQPVTGTQPSDAKEKSTAPAHDKANPGK